MSGVFPGTVITEATDALIRLALAEDVGTGDRTTMATIPASSHAIAEVSTRQSLVLAGTSYFGRVFHLLEPAIKCETLVEDGTKVSSDTVVLRVSGPTRQLLTGERTALNILQRLSGVATLARQYVDAIEGTDAAIVDTRKTTPGMRAMQKHAVVCGGGSNHRFGLDSGILIKENHIFSCGSVTKAVQLARQTSPHVFRIEVEVTTVDEAEEALEAGADVLLLDNMSTHMMADIVSRVRVSAPRVLLEASGNLGLERVREVADTGVNFLSVGALTHSAPSVDLSMEIVE